MPLPKPKKGEKQDDFISRCMSNKTMKDEYPDQKQRVAICYSQWRSKEMNTMIEFNYQVPIKESQPDEGSKDFIIEGTAINATTTANGHKYPEEELEKSAKTLNGVVLLKNHDNRIESLMGRVIESKYGDKKVEFRAKVIDEEAQGMIKDGRLNSVSVGAIVESNVEDEDGSYVARGITFRELSLVAVGADEGAEFGVALSEACNLTTDKKHKEEIAMTEKIDKTEAPETVTQEELTATVAKAVKEALEAKEAADKKIADEKAAEDEKLKEAELKAKEKADKEVETTKIAKEAADKKIADEKAAEEKKLADEKAAKIAKEAEERDSKYKFTETAGSLKGGAMTMERVI